MDVVELASGPKCGFYAIVVQGKCIVQDYISTLQEKDKKKVIALLDHICHSGPPTNEEKFRYLGDQIWELKTSSAIRILGFFINPLLRKQIVLTHGFRKPKNRILQREKKKAVQWREEYFRGIDNNQRR